MQQKMTIIFSSAHSFDSHPGLFQFLTFEKALQLDRIIKEVVIMAFRYFYSRQIDEECEETGLASLLHGSIAGFAPAPGCRAVIRRQVDLLPFYLLAAFKIWVLSVYLRHTKISTLDLEVAFPGGAGPIWWVCMISSSAFLSVVNHTDSWFVRYCVALGPTFPSGSPWTQMFLLLRSSMSANFAFTAVNDFDSEREVRSTISVCFELHCSGFFLEGWYIWLKRTKTVHKADKSLLSDGKMLLYCSFNQLHCLSRVHC